MTKKETIKKRLHRARVQLRNDNFKIQPLSELEIQSRLDTVLKMLYLLFNEGYFSITGNQTVRKELCSEAVRLMLVLTENSLTNVPRVNALLALMCFQSSRLDARTGINGEAILFDNQDIKLWDQSLIDRGNYYLVNACCGTDVSKYHIEAGIAYWHTAPTNDNKWKHILQLYNQLLVIEYSPVTALNRVFAFSKIHGFEKAIKEVEKLDLSESNYFYELLGYLYSSTNPEIAIQHYTTAIKLTKSPTEQKTIKMEIERLQKMKKIS
ncbi:hypothetical protein OKW96_16025 [Sphingobacterium sp. KU25419]|nr:hypothetical protein OKW96_16025 [Sphingobacterium sp. KU25419]